MPVTGFQACGRETEKKLVKKNGKKRLKIPIVINERFFKFRDYSGTPLIRPPSGHDNLVVLTG